MATTTVKKLIKSSIRVLVGRQATISIQELKDGLEALNALVSSLSVKPLVIPALTYETFPLVAGQSIYTIGAGADFNTVRPLKIIQALIRDANSDDHDLRVFYLRSYAELQTKGVDRRPTMLYYDPTTTAASIYFDSEPSEIETLHLWSEKQITEFTLNGSVVLPDEYKRMLKYWLAIELAPEYGASVTKEIAASAADAMAIIETNIAGSRMENTKYTGQLTYSFLKG